MKTKGRKLMTILLIIVSIIFIGNYSYSHSGRTDSNGGHKDNKNKSGLGSYHYHCGGNPPHLHQGGVCPYSSNKKSESGSSTTSTTTPKKTTTTKKTEPEITTIVPTEIKINENIVKMEIGENKKITATITPDNATNKNIVWKSSDEKIATINSNGEILAKQNGTVDITATTSNGKISTMKISIEKEEKIEQENTIETMVTNKNQGDISSNDKSKEDINPTAGILIATVLAGGSYLGYKKYKNSKKQ